MELVKWDEIANQIATNTDVKQLSELRNKLVAYKELAKQTKQSLETQNKIAEYRLRVDRKLGVWSVGLEKKKSGPTEVITSPVITGKMEYYKEIDIAPAEMRRKEAIASVPEEDFEKHIAKTKAEKRELTSASVYRLVKKPPTENIPLPSGVYDVIYADPPWEYKNAGFSMSAANQYPTMPIEDLKTMAIKDISATDSVLFLWATNPQLKDALELIDAWGFEYKTNFVWEKSNHTAGFYVYGQHELLLIAVRGSMLPTGKKFKSIIQGENKKHSKKPEVVYGIIEQMYPASKYIELFAREPRSGWKSWGNEIE